MLGDARIYAYELLLARIMIMHGLDIEVDVRFDGGHVHEMDWTGLGAWLMLELKSTDRYLRVCE